MAVLREGVDPGVFLHETWLALDPPDFYEGYIKGAFFGGQIAIISCFKGFNTSGGARGVGEAATAAVVLSSVSILVGTYLLAEALHPLLPPEPKGGFRAWSPDADPDLQAALAQDIQAQQSLCQGDRIAERQQDDRHAQAQP